MIMSNGVRMAGVALLGAGIIASGAAALRAQAFTRAERGWLYVVTSDYKTQTRRVLVVDPVHRDTARPPSGRLYR
jgi:hypothetical protein